MNFPVYLDYNATTPCDERVVEAMLPFFTKHFGNAASRSHPFGWEAEEGVEFAREQVAKLIGAEHKEVIFTSGATESDNLALKGIFEAYASKGNHIVTVNTEHKAVLDTCHHLQKEGGDVTYLNAKTDGLIDINELEAAIKPSTVLIAVMYANNETGVIQPVKQIGAIAKKHSVLFFSDATQAVGKIPVNVIDDEIDLMAFSAHKMYGPKGVGALYIRRKNPRVKVAAQMDGGGHERGARSGTLNVPGIVGFGKACDLAAAEMISEGKRLKDLRNKFEKSILGIEGITVNGNMNHRLPHVSNISFAYVDGNALMIALNKTLAVSSGSACTSASPEPSHVLRALGLEDDLAHSSLRFSLGRKTTEDEIDYVIELVTKTVKNLREAINI
jgi:cysteine desulfurase